MRLTKTQWAGHVERWRSSGSSAREYCANRGLKVSTLRYWSRRVRQETSEGGSETVEKARRRFAKVRTRKAGRARSGESPSTRSPLRLIVDGIEVEVPVEFDAGTLRRVVEVLRSGGGSR